MLKERKEERSRFPRKQSKFVLESQNMPEINLKYRLSFENRYHVVNCKEARHAKVLRSQWQYPGHYCM